MLKHNLCKIFLVAFILGIYVQGYTDDKNINFLIKKFNIKNREIAEKVYKLLSEKWNIKDLSKERVIDKILQELNLSIESLKKIGNQKLKIGTLAPSNTPWMDGAINTLKPFIEWESRGFMRLVVFEGGVMGEDKDILRKMRLGQLQGCGCTALGFLSAVPERIYQSP